MPSVGPFRALRYDPERVALSRVCAPSLASIPAPGGARFRRQDLRHVAHLAGSGRTPSFFAADWLRAGVLLLDEEPAFYAVRQRDLEASGEEQLGFFGMVSPDRGAPAAGLRHLASGSSEPATALFDDARGRVLRTLSSELDELEPELRVALDGVEYELFVLDDETVCARLAAHLDGAALTVVEGGPSEPGAPFVAFLAPAGEGGRTVAPLDLLVRSDRALDDLLDSARAFFDVETVDGALVDVRRAGGEVIVRSSDAFALRLRDDAPLDAVEALDADNLPPPGSPRRVAAVIQQLLADANVEAAVHGTRAESDDTWVVQLPLLRLGELADGALVPGYATLTPPVAAGLVVGGRS